MLFEFIDLISIGLPINGPRVVQCWRSNWDPGKIPNQVFWVWTEDPEWVFMRPTLRRLGLSQTIQ
jgi:hypothetical protein